MSGFLPARERYYRDHLFRAFVDAMYHQIAELQLTPTEVREAAMLATLIFEERHPRPFQITTEQREALLGYVRNQEAGEEG